MRKLILGVLFALLAHGAQAQIGQIPQYLPTVGGCSSHFCGDGDIIAFDAWYSCTYAYSFAYALPGTNVACLLAKEVGNNLGVDISTCTLYLQPDGNADINTTRACDGGTTTVNTWGQYRNGAVPTATGTGSASGTVLTIVGPCTNNFRPDMQISGAVYITSNGTGTGCAGTYNLSGSLSLGSGMRTGTPPIIRVKIYYDQTASGACSGSCDAIAASATERVSLAWNGDGRCITPALPCTLSATMLTKRYLSAGDYTPTFPQGYAGVAAQVSGQNRMVSCGGDPTYNINTSIVINNISLQSGNWYINGNPLVSATDNVLHSAAGRGDQVGGTQYDATLNIDGVEAQHLGTGDGTAASHIHIFGRAGQTGVQFDEGGCANNKDFDATVRAALIANQRKRYGTP